jgi:hypothetical protein
LLWKKVLARTVFRVILKRTGFPAYLEGDNDSDQEASTQPTFDSSIYVRPHAVGSDYDWGPNLLRLHGGGDEGGNQFIA